MEKQREDEQHEPTYSNSVPIRGLALKTCWKQWTIGRGGERGSGISVMMSQTSSYATTQLEVSSLTFGCHQKKIKENNFSESFFNVVFKTFHIL